jgi:Helix-turn-helix domain of resolvase
MGAGTAHAVGDWSVTRFRTILLRAAEMTHTAQAVPQILTRSGRPTKFTPERIQQIKNLVERGKSRNEIAELLDVTVGSLQVTCSRLGISLRRIVLNNGVGPAPCGRCGSSEEARQAPNHGSRRVAPLQVTPAQFRPHLPLVGEAQHSEKHQERPSALEAGLAGVTIKMRYKGAERTTELSLTEEMIVTLALEAELRHLRIGELISEIIVATMNKDLLQVVLAPPTVPGE